MKGRNVLFKRTSFIPSEEVGGELVVLDAENDLIFSSNAVGALVWQKLLQPVSLDDLCSAVVSSFEGAQRDAVKEDVVEFLDALSERNLVERIAQ